MSTNMHRADWTWLSLFGPKNTNGIPSIEGNSQEDYEVDEQYIEGETIETDDSEDDADVEDEDEEEAEGMLVNYDDDEDD